MECVDLKQRFGERYRVTYEESYYVDRGDGARTKAPWLMVLPCKNGYICPWGGSTLVACTNANGSVASQLRKLPFTTVAQDGDDGVNVLFDVKYLDEIAAIMKPRRRRRLSESQKRKSIERLRHYWPVKGETVRKAVPQDAKSPRKHAPKVGPV